MANGLSIIIGVVAILVFLFIILNKNNEKDQPVDQSDDKPDSSYVKQDSHIRIVAEKNAENIIADKLIGEYETSSYEVCTPYKYAYNTHKKDNLSYFESGDYLGEIVYQRTITHSSPSTKHFTTQEDKRVPVFAPSSGYVLYGNDSAFGSGATYHFASIYQSLDNLWNYGLPFSYVIEKDDFTGESKLKWTHIQGKEYTQFLEIRFLEFSFNIKDSTPVLVLKSIYKQPAIASILFMFDDNEIKTFHLFKDNRADGNCIIDLTTNDITKFCEHEICKIRVQTKQEQDITLDDYDRQAVQRFVIKFVEALTELGINLHTQNPTYQEPVIEDDTMSETPISSDSIDAMPYVEVGDKTETDESCWVYLMKDTTNNAYKIGISKRPEYREKTLQSEKPTIIKIAAKWYPTRVLARTIESSLHKVYADKHLRGEWFQLSDKEAEEVKKSLE